jgi:hypothetical protein
VLDLPDAFASLAAADLDGDGTADLVVLTAAGGLATLVIAPDGSLRPGLALAPAEAGRGCRGIAVRAADLDADGRADLVAAFAAEPGPGCPTGGSLRAWLSVGDD